MYAFPSGLIQDGDGIWQCTTRSPVSYPVEGNRHRLRVEDQSYWFCHRNFCIVEAVRRFPPRGPLVDVGGGNGFVTLGLQQAGYEAALVEPDPHGAAAARARGIEHVICGAFQDVGFAEGSVDALGLFDVLEHIEDDFGALRTFHRCLGPGGRLYLTVPAYQWLASDRDRALGHFRRYSLKSLRALVAQAGFKTD
ncbi:MAG TPA: class I SAM-dependent methyltransferase, partial [Stellaceae bacterium]|nr:class I SAM-dependent methyltransferase [Stellaceae bacterium]